MIVLKGFFLVLVRMEVMEPFGDRFFVVEGVFFGFILICIACHVP